MKKFSMKHLLAALVLGLAVAIILPVAGSTTAEAKTTKITAANTYKKAKALKLGVNIVTDKNKKVGPDGNLTKFTAPANGKYTLTISDMVVGKKPSNSALCNIYLKRFEYPTSTYLSRATVKTEGGKSDIMWCATKNYDTKYLNKGKVVDQYRKTRSMTLSLKAGQTVYVSTWSTGGPINYKLTVKKK